MPVEVKAGSLLLIHGEVLHRSKVNLSPKSRNVYTFHVFDAGVSKWSNENWFVSLLSIMKIERVHTNISKQDSRKSNII